MLINETLDIHVKPIGVVPLWSLTSVYGIQWLLSDSRAMSYLPSTLAAATMIHVIKEIESFNATKYIDQLLGLLKISEVCLFNLIDSLSLVFLFIEYVNLSLIWWVIGKCWWLSYRNKWTSATSSCRKY